MGSLLQWPKESWEPHRDVCSPDIDLLELGCDPSERRFRLEQLEPRVLLSADLPIALPMPYELDPEEPLAVEVHILPEASQRDGDGVDSNVDDDRVNMAWPEGWFPDNEDEKSFSRTPAADSRPLTERTLDSFGASQPGSDESSTTKVQGVISSTFELSPT